jgi:DNA-binding transcriptional MerR regulator
MPGHYTPTAAAAMIGISVSTLRNYCATFKSLLSPDAAPPAGTERRLTPADVATLQRVRELRDQGMAPADIVATLQATLQTEGTDTLQPYIDTQLAPAPTPVPAPITAPTTGLQTELQTIQRQIDTLEERRREDASQRTSMIVMFAAGMIAGLLLAIVGILLMSAGAGLFR